MSEGSSFVDYYELLGISTSAAPLQIREAFLRLAKQHHPDVGGSTAAMQQFTQAYRTLMSASSRKKYDLLHDFYSGTSKPQYREYGTVKGTSLDDLSDEEIDTFIDQVFAAYHQYAKPKKSFLSKLKNYL